VGDGLIGIWHDTAEWGPAYSMVMTEACEPASMVGLDGRATQTRVHDRIPAILPEESSRTPICPQHAGTAAGASA
jgi:hypothetical protein